MRTPILTAATIALAFGGSAGAQSIAEGWEVDGKAQAVIAISSMDSVERLPARSVLGELAIRATAEKTLENSAEIGFRFEAKAQLDHPARAGFTGNVEPFDLLPVDGALNPGIRGAYSGLTRSGELEDKDFVGAIETAQAYIDGGYGQVSIGYGRGVAVRFHEGAPDIFTHVRAANPKLDPGGINIVRTENDLTGPAPKLTYQTPRLLGVRAGVSFTPKANVAGVDRDPRRAVPGVISPDIENVWEVSTQLSRKLSEPSVRIRASASYTTGEVSVVDPSFDVDDVTVWSAGAELEFKRVSLGADYLSSNNGLARDGDYRAWSAGVTTGAFGWDWGLRYGESEEENIRAEAQNWSIGGATKISQNIKVAAGYQSTDLELGEFPFTNPFSSAISGPDGAVVEITLSY